MEHEKNEVPHTRRDTGYDYKPSYWLNTSSFIGYNNYYIVEEKPVATTTNMGSGGAADAPYNELDPTGIFPVNDET